MVSLETTSWLRESVPPAQLFVLIDIVELCPDFPVARGSDGARCIVPRRLNNQVDELFGGHPHEVRSRVRVSVTRVAILEGDNRRCLRQLE